MVGYREGIGTEAAASSAVVTNANNVKHAANAACFLLVVFTRTLNTPPLCSTHRTHC
jgi:hypothetical protein